MFEVYDFFISRAGRNYPCVNMKSGSADLNPTNSDSWHAKLMIGEVDYMPLDQFNVTSNEVIYIIFKKFIKNLLLYK